MSFRAALFKEMITDLFLVQRDNWSHEELGEEPEVTFKEWVKPVFKPLLRYRELKGTGYLYSRLEDEFSRNLLVKIIAYRYMGYRKVKLPRNNPETQKLLARMENLDKVGEPISIAFQNAKLNQYNLSGIGYGFNVFCSARGGSYIFLQRQYEYNRNGTICRAEPGDVVIDAGACWGETTLYFADAVGPKGQVIAFEFIPSNTEVLQRNIEINPKFAETVTIVEQPLWNVEGQELFYKDWGPGSMVSFEKLQDDFPDTKCLTTTIDEVVSKYSLSSVDFIKMDIEGAEPYALEGARETIREFHPKLAISLYHNIEDFKSVPGIIESIGMQYRYYLDHHTIYQNETVLFAVPLK